MAIVGRVMVAGIYAVVVFFVSLVVGARYLTCGEPTVEANLRPGITAMVVLAVVAALPWLIAGLWGRKAWYFAGGVVATLPCLYWIVTGLDLDAWRLAACM